jgi:hypothetical protein
MAAPFDRADELEAIAVDVRGLAQLLSAVMEAPDTPEWCTEALGLLERNALALAERLQAVVKDVMSEKVAA